MANEFQKRQIAKKAAIITLLKGIYVKEGGFTPNHVDVDGNKIARVNIIATVVELDDSMQYTGFVLDDSTARISVRVFESKELFSGIAIGDTVLVIGRPREFSQERYIIAEIVKKLSDSRWVLARKIELEEKNNDVKIEGSIVQDGFANDSKKSPKTFMDESTFNTSEQKESPVAAIYSIIKSIDKGNGADLDEVIAISKESQAEKIIRILIEEGEIFEIRPGRLKVLE